MSKNRRSLSASAALAAQLRGAFLDPRFELRVEPLQLGLRAALGAFLHLTQRAADDGRQLVHPELEDVIGRAFFQPLDGDVLAEGAGEKDEWNAGRSCCQTACAAMPSNPGTDTSEMTTSKRRSAASRRTAPAYRRARRRTRFPPRAARDHQFGVPRIVFEVQDVERVCHVGESVRLSGERPRPAAAR